MYIKLKGLLECYTGIIRLVLIYQIGLISIHRPWEFNETSENAIRTELEDLWQSVSNKKSKMVSTNVSST